MPSMPVTRTPQARPSCWACRHFGISHDARLPYLCRSIQIKTRTLPAEEVFRASGQECSGYEPKPPQRPGS